MTVRVHTGVMKTFILGMTDKGLKMTMSIVIKLMMTMMMVAVMRAM